MIEFKMPSLGADMDKGTLVAWHFKPGDHVNRGDIIADVETQKGTIEVEIWETGTISEMLVEPGKEVPVGTVLALLQSEKSVTDVPSISMIERTPPSIQELSMPTPLRESGQQRVIPKVILTGPSRERRLRVTPLARKVAVEKGIDPALVHGSGPQGAITRLDVDQYSGEKIYAEKKPSKVDGIEKKSVAMRQAIATSMSRSKREIPHYYLQTEINMEPSLSVLEKVNAEKSVTDRILSAALYIKAVAKACARVPEMNGFWLEGQFHPVSAVHIGVGISLRHGGLVAPAIHDVGNKSIQKIMTDLLDLVARARSGKIRSSEISDPTITITNLGDQGVETVFGVIYPPQVALIGFGKINSKPWASDGMIGVKPVVTATLSADHRASDGHRGGIFLNLISKLLSDPKELDFEI